MSSNYNPGPTQTYIAGAALGQYIRVKHDTDPDDVVAAGATDAFIGTTCRSVASGDPVAIRDWNGAGTHVCVAAGAITKGAAVYGAAGGKVDDAVAGSQIGVAETAATADGDFVTVTRDSASL